MAISYVGSASGATTATLPDHQSGDVIICFAFRSTNGTIPTAPAGWTVISTQTSGTNRAAALAYRVAVSSGTAVGTWTNATSVAFSIYRGVNPSTPIGAYASFAASLLTIGYKALALNVNDGPSWVVGVAGVKSAVSALETAPAGMVSRVNYVGAAEEVVIHDSAAPLTSWDLQTVSLGTGSAVAWSEWTFQLIGQTESILPVSYTLNLAALVGSSVTTCRDAAKATTAVATLLASRLVQANKAVVGFDGVQTSLTKKASASRSTTKGVVGSLVKLSKRSVNAVAPVSASISSLKARLMVLATSVAVAASTAKRGLLVQSAAKAASASVIKRVGDTLTRSVGGAAQLLKRTARSRIAVEPVAAGVSKMIRLGRVTSTRVVGSIASSLGVALRSLAGISTIFASMVVNGLRVVRDKEVQVVRTPLRSEPNTAFLTYKQQPLQVLVHQPEASGVLTYMEPVAQKLETDD